MGALVGALQTLEGFFTIGVLILVGWILARTRVLTTDHRKMMSHIALFVASPALMFNTMAGADLHRVFDVSVIAAYGAIVTTAVLSVVAGLWWFHRSDASTPGRAITAMLACYSNAGNLGIPVAAYALHDVTWVVPILLVQIAVLQPTALAILDWHRARDAGAPIPVAKLLTLPIRNPLTVGVLLGLALNLIHGRESWVALPDWAARPVVMLGDVAIPLMLIAFGVSLCLDPKPARGIEGAESWFLVALKIVVQPVVAFALAVALHLDPVSVRAVTVVAGLPSAQNIFVIASTYDRRMVFARDTIFRSTAVSVVTLLATAAVLA